ncbi:hypothetical protein IWW38_001596 [Coemansia aciculifera]|uniref:Uncharacterized protein n=1 Tax=Coemansia aciculifera TaxID=417176 RepID=A0ACC1M5X3_9FUNG|nr:hypothetical protein IWW38_001596 [Coemansia aciculifera]
MHSPLTISSCVAAILAASTLVSSAAADKEFFPKRESFDVAPRIIGGQPALSTQFQYIAYIEGYDPIQGGSSCTGSLIAPNVVLTAGHCVYASDTQMYTAAQIQVGFTHTTPDPTVLFQGYSVSQIIANPSFSMGTLKSDIALLILSNNIPDSVATKAKLYAGSFSSGTSVTAAGFGLIDPNSKTQLPSSLMEVGLKLGTTSFCQANFPTVDINKVVCTDGTAGKDTCNGDSGGPLAIAVSSGSPDGTALLGLTSFGPISSKNPLGLCGQPGIPGYYTLISPYISWIAKAANLNANSISVGGSSNPVTPISSSSKPTTSKTATRTTPVDDTNDTPTDSTTSDSSSSSPTGSSKTHLNAAPVSSGSASFALAMAVLGSAAAYVAF